jgi:hypothetical protein
MSTNRKEMTKEDEGEMFQKASEAIRLLGENPDALRGFLDSLKKGDFSEARMSLSASLDRRREADRAVAEPSRVPSSTPEK